MSTLDRGPRQLAEAVLRALSLAVVDAPMPSALALFFDVLYEASFRTERGQPVRCSLLWQEPGTFRTVPFSPEELPLCGSYIPFTSPIPFSTGSVLNLSKALDPQASALAVFGAEGLAPNIHGLVNYGADSSLSVPAKWEAQAGVCGSFRATIVGPAHISVDAGLDYPIELKRNTLRADSQSPLRRGPLRDRLAAALRGLPAEVQAQLTPELAASPFLGAVAIPLKDGSVFRSEYDWAESLERLWVTTLARILLKVRENGGGAAVLVTPRAANSPERAGRLQVPYALEFAGLQTLLQQRGAFWMERFIKTAKALSEQPRAELEIRPEEMALPEPDPRDGPIGSDHEINQAIAFIASLAQVEGILLLTPQLALGGFGALSTGEDGGKDVYLAGDDQGSEANLSPVPAHAFGPRCSVLLRQCSLDPEAIGFFLTQDGDLRAMMQHEDRILVWDPVRLPRA